MLTLQSGAIKPLRKETAQQIAESKSAQVSYSLLMSPSTSDGFISPEDVQVANFICVTINSVILLLLHFVAFFLAIQKLLNQKFVKQYYFTFFISGISTPTSLCNKIEYAHKYRRLETHFLWGVVI